MKKLFAIALLAAALPLASSCTLNQEPEGEGENPTKVNLTVNVDLRTPLPQQQADSIVPAVDTTLCRRFVVDVVTPDGAIAARNISYQDVVPGQKDYSFDTNFRLKARQYQVLVWCDYVKKDSKESNLDYDITSLTPILPASATYTGNNERKDCFCGHAEADLRKYEESWGEKVDVDVKLSRPVGRFEIVANDLKLFRDRIQNGKIAGSDFEARIRFADYCASGYNVMLDVPKNFLKYQYFKTALKYADIPEGQESLRLAFDYTMVAPGAQGSSLPLEIEIVNEKGIQVSRAVVSVPVVQGMNTVVNGKFLTSSAAGGVSVDTEFEGSISIDLGQL